jgi:broad specificity phosphatase PhoE
MTFICHGPTAATKSAGFPADEPLVDSQAAAASRISAVLRHAHAFLSAPELRTRQTAAMLAGEFAVDPSFRDLDYGRWSGRDMTEVAESEPESLTAWITDVAAAPHGGESIAAMIVRIGARLATQIDAGGHTVVVTHPAVIRAAVIAVLDAPAESFRKIDVRPFCIAELTSDGRRWALRSFGYAPIDQA